MIKNKVSILLLIGISFICFWACNRNNYVLTREKMEEVLYDLSIAEATANVKYNDFEAKGKKDDLFNDVLEKHGITKEVLDSSLVWYSDNVDVYFRINDSVISRLKRDQAIYAEMQRVANAQSDRRGFREFPSYIFLTPVQPFHTFVLDSLKVIGLQVDSIPSRLTYGVLGISPEVDLMTVITYEYSDTAIIKTNRGISGVDTLYTPVLEDRKLKSLHGSFKIDSELENYNILLYNISFETDSTRTANVIPAEPGEVEILEAGNKKLQAVSLNLSDSVLKVKP